MNIIQRQSPNITKGRNGWKPDIISCHITEGNYIGAVGWLLNPVSQVSAHFVVSKTGEITQLVSLEDTAWCNGTKTTPDDSRFYGNSNLKAVRDRKSSANYYTISIEHEGFYKDAQGMLTPVQLTATVELMKHIRSEVKRIYGIDIPIDRQNIVAHCDITPKWKPNCPGQRYPFDEIIKRLKEDSEMRYNSINEIPAYAKATVQKLMNSGVLAGTAGGKLDLSDDMLRMLVINDRAGLYEKK